MSARYNNIAMT